MRIKRTMWTRGLNIFTKMSRIIEKGNKNFIFGANVYIHIFTLSYFHSWSFQVY